MPTSREGICDSQVRATAAHMAPWNHAPPIAASVAGPGCWLGSVTTQNSRSLTRLGRLDQSVKVQAEVFRGRAFAAHLDDESPELAVGSRQEHGLKSTTVTAPGVRLASFREDSFSEVTSPT